MTTIFQSITKNLEHAFDPDVNFCSIDFEPTAHPPGSLAKIDVLARRLELGQPLWHELDSTTYEGFRGHDDQPGVNRHRNKTERRAQKSGNIRIVRMCDVKGAAE